MFFTSVRASLAGVAILLASIASASAINQWTWMQGADQPNQPAVYGEVGVPAAANTPGFRSRAATWTDAEGNFWLFGGMVDDYLETRTHLGDLWRFNPTSRVWTWMGGTNQANSGGVYGERGIPASSNRPGGRADAAFWTGEDGRFWLMGGTGIDAAGNPGLLNDLWCYDPATGQWTWVHGSNVANDAGHYPTVAEMSSAADFPGARSIATTWVGNDGQLWLFGGLVQSTASWRSNELWRFDPAARIWTLAYGSSGIVVIGETPSGPGERAGAVGWADRQGDLWLFGGYGRPKDGGSLGSLNELWRYSTRSGEWTFVKGSTGKDQNGVYGTMGEQGIANTPGARGGVAGSWVDAQGRFWLLGGNGFGSSGIQTGYLNDLWRFDFATQRWIWMKGATGTGASPSRGDLLVEGMANDPGSRVDGASWVDAKGMLWMFGGQAPSGDKYSDVWRFTIEPVPVVQTGLNTSAAGGAVTFRATVDPNNQSTDVVWDYGTLPDFSDTTQLTTIVGNEPLPLSTGVTGLIPHATYYVRARASNESGTGIGKTKTVRIRLIDPELTVRNVRGQAVPNEDASVVFQSLGSPSVGPFAGKYRSQGKVSAAVFTAQGLILLSSGRETPGLPTTVIDKFGEVSGQAAVVILKHGPGGANGANDTVLLTGLDVNSPTAAVREGDDLPDSSGAKWKSFGSIDGYGATVFFMAKARGNGVNASNDDALGAIQPDGTVRVLVREGISVDGQLVKSIITLFGTAGSLGEDRWRVGPNAIGVKLGFKDGSQRVYTIPGSAMTPEDWSLRMTTGESISAANELEEPDFATVQAIGFPGFSADSAVFSLELDALLPSYPNQVAALAGKVIVYQDLPDGSAAGNAGVIHNAEGAAIAGLSFSKLGTPVNGAGSKIAFAAKAIRVISSVKETYDGLWYGGEDRKMKLLARVGGAAPGGGRWAKFEALALPNGETSGPIFTAKLAINKADGVTKLNSRGFWGVDSLGNLRLLLRDGQDISINGHGTKVRSFVALVQPGGTSEERFVSAIVTTIKGEAARVLIELP